MTEISEHVDFQVILQTAVAPRASFGIELHLLDTDEVPIDIRFRYTTEENVDDDFTIGSGPHNFAAVFFGQKRVPDKLMVGRWAKAATNPLFVCGSAYEKDYLVWKAITTGSFKVVDSALPTPAEDSVTAVDFSAITSLADVPTILAAKIQAISSPNITGLDTSTFEFDALGRLELKMSTSGDAAKSVHILPAASGVDLSAVLMDAPNGKIIAGIDAETPQDALAAISDIDDSYYNVSVGSAMSDAEQLAFAAYINTKSKQADLHITDPDAYDPASTADVPYQLAALGNKRVTCIHHITDTTQYPLAATAGVLLPAQEGTTNWAFETLTGITASNNSLGNPLTAGQKLALHDKKCCYINVVGSSSYLYDGITSGGEEKRIMLGRDWFVARCAEAIFTDQLNNPLMAFDNKTLALIASRIWTVANEAISRDILVNTVERPFTVTMPDADTITTAERATHKLTVYNVFSGYINSAINDYKLVGNWML